MTETNPKLDKAILECKLNRLALIESKYTLLTEPGVYYNLHHPHLLVQVTKDGKNVDAAGSIMAGGGGVLSEHWAIASPAMYLNYFKNRFLFAQYSLQYRVINFFKNLYQRITNSYPLIGSRDT